MARGIRSKGTRTWSRENPDEYRRKSSSVIKGPSEPKIRDGMSCRCKVPEERKPLNLTKIIMNTNFSFNMTQAHYNKYNNILQAYASQINKKELRLDVSEWIESSSRYDKSSSCFILTIVQRPGSREQQIIPQEYKNMSAACVESTRLLAEVMAEVGARRITSEIRNNRFFVITDNDVKITMVID